MSLDRNGLIVVLLLLGHAGVWIVLLNVTHALGLSDRPLQRLRALVLSIGVALAALLVACAALGPLSRWHWVPWVYALVCLATLLVLLPLATLRRWLRREPRGVSGGASELDLAAAEGKNRLIGQGKHAWLLRVPGNESFRLRMAEWEVALAGLPGDWDGLSLVHLSDLHLAPCFERRYFEAVAEAVAGWDADLVALTGDLVDHDQVIEWLAPFLSGLRGRRGAFAILGNHDFEHQPHRLRRAITEGGFIDLDGRWTELAIEGATLAVGGTSFPWGPALDHRVMPEADFRILLSHSPDQFPRAARWGVDLVLSGHNHAGQIRVPVIGPVFMPSVYSRLFDRGFFRQGESLLHVSQGIAGKHPFRYGGCLPEVTRLVLRRAAVSPPSRVLVSKRSLDGSPR
jgi:predicted MPP superfamily phosphohydrolase